MTQEDKELLLRDLCARLPYGVVMNVTEPGEDRVNFNCFLGPDIIKEITSEIGHFKYKPYLRPMSSMTKEEKIEYEHIAPGIEIENCVRIPNVNQIDWLLAHHFDYRKSYDLDRKEWLSMIEKGLALEAPEGMYK